MFPPLNKPGFYLGPGVYLGQAFNSFLSSEETIYPTSTRSKLLISAVTHGGVHLFLHHPDHFAGHSLVSCPFADNAFPHIHLKLLASLLPPSTKQPGPVAVLFRQTLKLCLIFSPISSTLLVNRETSSGCSSRVFLCIFYGRKFEFQVALFYFFAPALTVTMLPQTWRINIMSNESGVLSC